MDPLIYDPFYTNATCPAFGANRNIGNGLMIHSTAEGVGWISATQFLRCDRVMLLRPKWGQEKAVYRLNKWIGKDYDFEFKSGNEFFYCHELGAEAYQELGIEKLIPSNWISKILGFFGIKFEKVYLAESFIQNENFSSLLKFGK